MKRALTLVCLGIATHLLATMMAFALADKTEAMLLRAAEKGKTSEVISLLEGGAAVDFTDKNDRTPLIKAADNGHADTVEVLLEKGADPNHIDKDGFSALRLASVSGYMDVVRILLEAKADPNTKHSKGITPLMAASVKGHTGVVELLLNHGADFSFIDEENIDALCYASSQRDNRSNLPRFPETIRMLLKAGADPSNSRCFIHPDYADRKVKSISLIQIEDARSDKGKSADLLEQMEKALAKRVVDKRRGGLRLAEARQKLSSAGMSAAEVEQPNAKRACEILSVDAVFEAEIKDYKSVQFGIQQGSGMDASFRMTDCRTGELLFKNSGTYTESRGWITARFVSGCQMIVDAAVTLPTVKLDTDK
ncbi:MAG: ankyrin repeat domain-containing protein [Acidobacteria bacterium]|nr:ankyrin repeat domain-containing protein [Acidobacteriota bacterium]